ncbi:heavy metal translocating P-type ATPase [Anaerosolibacter sp.]|uniref:heavy metal translocating P-type ATPase n=1 Tax=Anaerosolibacter sp. TaxID=1872527 RepID=UPI0039F01D55
MHRFDILSAIPGRIRIRYHDLLHCSKRSMVLQRELSELDGIREVKITSCTNGVLVLYNPKDMGIKALIQRILSINLMKPIETMVEDMKEKRILEPKELPISFQKKQVILSGAVLAYTFVKTVVFGVPLMSLGPLNIASITTLATGWAIFKSGIHGLIRERKFNNDFLIATATALSLAMGEYMTGLVVIWLINISELFEAITIDRSRKAIRNMLSNTQEKAWLWVDGEEISLDVKDLKVDDIVVVHSGEKIPVDGTVIKGEALVNQAPITGESVPIIKEVAETVFAGTIVEQGKIYVRGQKVGDDTSIARIIHMVEQASTTRAPIQNIADVYADKLVPWSFALSGLVYLFTGDFIRAVTILIVACPCAAGLATPTALAAAMGNAAKKGILIKGGRYLEEIGQVDTVLFDKTGTLTKGKPNVTSIYPIDAATNQQETMYIAASCEQGNRHPLAMAVVNKALEMGVQPEVPDEIEVVIGRGVTAAFRENQVLLGSRRMMQENHIDLSRGEEFERLMAQEGETTIYLVQNNRLSAMIGIKDVIKEESPVAVMALNERGIDDIGMITGDSEATALAIAKELAIKRIMSDVLPDGKAEVVAMEKERGKRVLMVGDGVNDSPALALADVGVAMGTGGTDIAIETADIVLAGDNPVKIVEAVDISRKTMAVIKQSYGIAIGINALGIVLGAASLISPLTAAILHNASTVGVVINSSRLLKYEPKTVGQSNAFHNDEMSQFMSIKK